ncbi:MAG: hypothetical protein ACTSYR_05740, partial [Candidatus Odinarchaeia archaeon]
MVKVSIEALHRMFVDGYKITVISDDGVVSKYYMKFEDGIKNVFKWNVLSPFLAKLHIISSDYHISDPQKRWENEIKVIGYIRKKLRERDYPVYVPKVVTRKIKSIENKKLQNFLKQWEDYRYTIFEYVEGPTMREILLKPFNYNLKKEVSLLGKCIGVIHGFGVCQFDRRTTNDIRIPKGFCILDYSLAKIFSKWNNAFYWAVAYDIDNQKLWLPEELFKIFLESHDKYLMQIEGFNMKKYKKA